MAATSDLERRLGVNSILDAIHPGQGMPMHLGRFKVEGRIGGGGMGVVYRAHDPDLDRPVAIKVARGGSTLAHRIRVKIEARALARAAHENVVAVHEIGGVDDDLYVVMEYVDGLSLERWIEETKPSCAEILSRCIQAGRGLAAAHEAGVVHRDFKPQNVLVGKKTGRVRVVDFGLASVPDDDAPGVLRGYTKAYAAPEVLAGEGGTARSDQYSFCRTVLDILKRCSMFDGLSKALERGCHPDPDQRFASMNEVMVMLEAAA